MTNEEANRAVERSERRLRNRANLEARVYGASGLLTLVVSAVSALFAGFETWNLVVGYAMTAIFGFYTVIALGMMSLYKYDLSRRRLREFERDRGRRIWCHMVRSGVFGKPLVGTARNLSEKIQAIYAIDPQASLLPLPQAVRLFDVYRRQRERRNAIDDRLGDLHSTRAALVAKTDQLQQLGEHRSIAREVELLATEIEPLEELRDKTAESYRRLEAVIGPVLQTVQARQLHRELDDLQSQLPGEIPPHIEPTFEAESLEEIERQIGREIETYLRLERETEGHLR